LQIACARQDDRPPFHTLERLPRSKFRPIGIEQRRMPRKVIGPRTAGSALALATQRLLYEREQLLLRCAGVGNKLIDQYRHQPG
jgi:hypothetical protein